MHPNMAAKRARYHRAFTVRDQCACGRGGRQVNMIPSTMPPLVLVVATPKQARELQRRNDGQNGGQRITRLPGRAVCMAGPACLCWLLVLQLLCEVQPDLQHWFWHACVQHYSIIW